MQNTTYSILTDRKASGAYNSKFPLPIGLLTYIIMIPLDVCCLRFSHLPYDVTPEVAMAHEAVRDRIKHSMQCLQDTTEYFLSAILASVNKIP